MNDYDSKFDINLVIDFWELIISEDDRLFIFYFSIAILIHNRQVSLYKRSKDVYRPF